MPNWVEVYQEMRALADAGDPLAADTVRQKYLGQLHSHTKRNVIAYYSAWLQRPNLSETQIDDDDKNSFMMAINGLDCSLGLDLVLHTPGGGIAATESIVDYLHRKFLKNNNVDIRVIVPQLAMSAGTMIACSASSILMGKQSNLGPIDPQLKGVPAHGVVEEFKRAHKEISADPSKLAVWQFILQKYQPTFLTECENNIRLSEEFVYHNLVNVMFKGDKDAVVKADKIVAYLTDYKGRKTHARHITIDEAKNIGLKIEDLEAEQSLQDLVLTIHHCYMHTLANNRVLKMTENHNGALKALVG